MITKYYKDKANNGQSNFTYSTELSNTGYVREQIVAVRSGWMYVKFCIDGVKASGLKDYQFYEQQKALASTNEDMFFEEITEAEFQTATGL